MSEFEQLLEYQNKDVLNKIIEKNNFIYTSGKDIKDGEVPLFAMLMFELGTWETKSKLLGVSIPMTHSTIILVLIHKEEWNNLYYLNFYLDAKKINKEKELFKLCLKNLKDKSSLYPTVVVDIDKWNIDEWSNLINHINC